MVKLKQQKQQIFWHVHGVERRNIGCETAIFIKLNCHECHIFGMFCRRFQELCGDLACKPNMHLSLHLKEFIFDYGPVNAFWCFTYESFNDIFGKFHITTQYQLQSCKILY